MKRDQLKSAFLKIKDKLNDKITDDEIVGQPVIDKKKKDLIPLASIFSDDNTDKISKKILTYLSNIETSNDREEKYAKVDNYLNFPEVDGVLDIYVNETLMNGIDEKTINVFSSNKKVMDIVNDLFYRIGIEDKAYEIIKNFIAYGDEFYEIVFSKNLKKITSINRIPRQFVGRNERNGILQYFFIKDTNTVKNTNNFSYNFNLSYNQVEKEDKKKIEPFRILHWKIPSAVNDPYGKSILESIFTVIEELKMMEQSLLIARITRAPERRIYNVNVGQAQGEKGIAYAREIVSRLKKKRILDASNNKDLELMTDIMGSIEDIVIPKRVGEEPSTVDTLPQLNDPGQLADIEFIRDRLFSGIGIPRQYLFDDTFANANTNLSNKNIQFAKRARRIQKFFIYNLYKIAIIQLRLLNINPKFYKDLTITMNNPSNIDEREKIETENARWGLISSMKSLNADKVFYNDFFIYKEILKLSDNEVLDLLKHNIIQQNDGNPFAFMPEDKRPEGYQILDQLKNPPQAEEGGENMGMEEETPPDEEEIPPEVEDQFGPPPEEADIGEPPPLEGEGATGEETPTENEEDMGEEPEIEEDEDEEAPTPELANYSYREKRKTIYLEKQKSLALKNKVMNKIMNEEKQKTNVLNKEKEIKMHKEAYLFTKDHAIYGNAMKEVVFEWENSMLNFLSNMSINRKAYLKRKEKFAKENAENIYEYLFQNIN
jgi:hypothetical protein